MKGSDFIFDCAHLLYYKCHKINIKRGGSYIDSPDQIKNKNAAINPINKKDNKWFKYAVIVALNHEEIKKKHPQRITKAQAFINKYNSEGISYPLEKDNQKKFEKINANISLNVLYCKRGIT